MASDREERNGSGSVLIIGGGLAGLKAAIDLAQIGWRSIVIERKSDTGGAILGLERQYPTDSCGFCHILPDRSEGLEFCLRMGLTHPSIEIIKNASLLDIRGKAGSFKATILKEASYVDEERCIGCGLCIDACPQEFPDPFEESLFLRKAIDRSSPYSSTFQIDLSACTRCANCAKVCPVSAIDLDANQKEEVIEAGAIIVATGFETLKPKEIEEYGYGKYPDVITSMEFERLMGRCLFQGGDSWKGRIRRPSDGKEPKRIAFIQCVGSRTKERPYCSSICCMIAIKEARMAIHHIPGVHCEIFFMDIRACGKGYEAYYKETRDLGVRMTRCIPGEVIHRKEDSALILRYEKEDGILEE
ncbi:MAG: 4Fe-4S binding protein, partial [Candidatus Bathyarchaeia archaeon]